MHCTRGQQQSKHLRLYTRISRSTHYRKVKTRCFTLSWLEPSGPLDRRSRKSRKLHVHRRLRASRCTNQFCFAEFVARCRARCFADRETQERWLRGEGTGRCGVHGFYGSNRAVCMSLSHVLPVESRVCAEEHCVSLEERDRGAWERGRQDQPRETGRRQSGHAIEVVGFAYCGFTCNCEVCGRYMATVDQDQDQDLHSTASRKPDVLTATTATGTLCSQKEGCEA